MKTTNVITKEGYDEIVRIFTKLKKEKIHWNKEKQIAAAQGDRSENAEYISAKENIRIIDRQLYKINYVLENSRIAETPKKINLDIILFGDSVRLLKTSQSNEMEEMVVKIVGTNELIYVGKINKSLCISTISPLGNKLLGVTVGFELEVNNVLYEVLEIIK